jgi:hypothetical protein
VLRLDYVTNINKLLKTMLQKYPSEQKLFNISQLVTQDIRDGGPNIALQSDSRAATYLRTTCELCGRDPTLQMSSGTFKEGG